MAWETGIVVTRSVTTMCWFAFFFFLSLSSFNYTWTKIVLPYITTPVANLLFSGFGQESLSATFPFLLVALPVLLPFLIASIATTKYNKLYGTNTNQHQHQRLSPPFYNSNTIAVVGFVLPCLFYILGSVLDAFNDCDTYGFSGSMLHLSNVCGFVAVIAMSIFIVPVTRTNAVCEAMCLSPVDAVRIHIWLGALAIIAAVLHGSVYFVNWWVRQGDLGGFWSQILPSPKCFSSSGAAENGISNVSCSTVLRNFTGIVAGFAMVALGVGSMNWVRRASYRLFYLVHVTSTPIILVATALHWNEAFLYLLPGLVLWMSTTLTQRLLGSESVELSSIEVIPSERPLYSITFKAAPSAVKQFRGGFYMQLRAPSITQLAHPFSVVRMPLHASDDAQNHIRVMFRAVGSFSTKLGEYLTTQSSPVLQVEFPYGVPLLDKVLQYKKVQVIAGGIGITAYLSVIQEFVRCGTASTELDVHWFGRDEGLFDYVLKEYRLEELMASNDNVHITLHHTSRSPDDIEDCVNRMMKVETGRAAVRNTRVTTFPIQEGHAMHVKSSQIASGKCYFENIGRFLLLLWNTSVGLVLGYLMYGHHQDRMHVWSRLWTPLLVIVSGTLTATGYVFCVRRYSFFLRWKWQLLPQSIEGNALSHLPGNVSQPQEDTDGGYRMAENVDTEQAATTGESLLLQNTIFGGIQHRRGRVPLVDILPLDIDTVGDGLINNGPPTTAILICGPNSLYLEVKRTVKGSIPIYKEEFEM